MMKGCEGKDLIVLGAGGHAKVVLATAQAEGWNCVGVYDDDPNKHGEHLLGVPVLGNLPDPADVLGRWLLAAIGSNAFRAALAARYPGAHWATAIHPFAHIHPSVRIGEGSVVFAGSVIQPETIVGRHAIINTGATIDHDCRLGDFVHVGPGSHLAGAVRLDPGVFMGIGSSAIPCVHVGAGCILGAGSAVVKDLPPNITAVGVPAKVIKQHSSAWPLS